MLLYRKLECFGILASWLFSNTSIVDRRWGIYIRVICQCLKGSKEPSKFEKHLISSVDRLVRFEVSATSGVVMDDTSGLSQWTSGVLGL